MIKNIVAVIVLVGAAVLSGASVAQADGLGAPGLRGQVQAAPADSSAADPVDWYDCSGKSNGNYPHPDDDTKFISCANGYAYEQDCPQGQRFDPEARECG